MKNEQLCHPKQQALSLLLYFFHRVYYLLALFSARTHSEAGLQHGNGFLELTRHLLEFLYIKELMIVVFLRPLLFGCSKKNTNDVEKISQFVTSSYIDVNYFVRQAFR